MFTPTPEIRGLRGWEIALRVLLGAALALGLTVFLLHTLQALAARVPLDYGEGPLLNQARLLAEGRPIYRSDLSDYPYTVANYPPLYPLAVSLVGRLAGFSYATGRVVSALATLACGIALGFIVLQMTGDRGAAALAGTLFLSFPYVIYWGSLGRVDMLALAFSLWGIWAALRWPDSPAGWGLSLLLLLAAVFTRQSYLLAAPLAVLVHLAIGNRRRGVLFALAFGMAVLLVGGILTWRTGGGFFFHIVIANANAFVPSRMLFTWLNGLFLTVPLIILGLWECSHYVRRREVPWLAIAYLGGSTLSGVMVGKVGSSVNYLLEWVAAIMMLVGIALARWRREVSPSVRWLLVLTLALQVPWSLYSGRVFLLQCAERRTAEPEMRQLEAMVGSAPGPVLADEMMSLLVLGGREVLLQPYELTLLAAEGKWDPRRVVADMAAGKFALILITDHSPFPETSAGDRWTPQMWAVIREQYEPVTVLAGTTVYRPRETPQNEE
ncbi:MAG: glycosyltransferase family 39 protein [Anaerolineae bacterium]|nr:glycosyltransferase family 39 protein [Anaerolineae bacterium]